MEKAANQLIEGTQRAQDEVPNISLELLRDKLEYFDVKAVFFENQNLILNEIIHNVDLKDKELLKEEQELTEKLAERAEVKKNLVNILKGLKNQRKFNKDTKKKKTLVKKNGFFNCPECPFKSKWNTSTVIVHISAVHRKLKPWKCSDCTKGKCSKNYHLEYFY